MTMVNNVIGVVNYVIAARPSLLNFMIADNGGYPGDCVFAGGASEDRTLIHGLKEDRWTAPSALPAQTPRRGCRDRRTGRHLGRGCPRLGERGHGSFYVPDAHPALIDRDTFARAAAIAAARAAP